MKKFSIAINSIVILFLIYSFFDLGHMSTAVIAFILLGGVSVTLGNQKKALIYIVLIGNIGLFLIGLISAIVVYLGFLAPKGGGAFIWGSVILIALAFPSGLNTYFIKIKHFSKSKSEVNFNS